MSYMADTLNIRKVSSVAVPFACSRAPMRYASLERRLKTETNRSWWRDRRACLSANVLA